ncbi:hypothetical protein V6N11_023861 [Hibiscus sabdariffa]|uniref:Uncharacterized protein n=1 Tax=Hibiscus sabdariffa TaxID=183260 RepID=A0ABR2TP97_9ROSI
MTKKAELVFIPSPEMGQLLSTVELAKHLLHLDSNLSISGPLVKEAVSNIVELSKSVPDSPRLAGFVLDMFVTPFIDVANEFGVPSYVFYTSGAAFLGFKFYVQVLHDEQNVEFHELKDSEVEFTIPTYANPVPIKSFPPTMFNSEVVTFVVNIAKGLREMRGIMVNTFSELESYAWPLHADQYMNAFLLVKDLGLAVDLKMDSESYADEVEIVKTEHIERGIRCLMEQDSEVRKRMKEMSDESRKALVDGGSLHSSLRRFIDDVTGNLS